MDREERRAQMLRGEERVAADGDADGWAHGED
jgi:hypothetical protein